MLLGKLVPERIKKRLRPYLRRLKLRRASNHVRNLGKKLNAESFFKLKYSVTSPITVGNKASAWHSNPSFVDRGTHILCCFRDGSWYNTSLSFAKVSNLDGLRKATVTKGLRCNLLPKSLRENHEDPRFFEFRGNLWLSFVTSFGRSDVARVAIAQLDADQGVIASHLLGSPFNFRYEKNWIFFQSGDSLYCTYSLENGRHQVMRFNESFEPDAMLETSYDLIWKWGEIRGGTNLVKLGDSFFGFFHSSTGGVCKQYFIGAYEMESVEPFRIKRVVPFPVYSAVDSHIFPDPETQKAVVFPTSLSYKDGIWTVSAGYNDQKIFFLTIDHAHLQNCLVSSISVENPHMSTTAMPFQTTAE